MKKPILLAAGVLVVLTMSALSANHYNKYQNKQTQEAEAEQSSQQVAVDAAVKAEQDKFAVERDEIVLLNNNLRTECEKGLAAYNALSAFEKKSFDEPQCGLVLVR
jgi:hypothetical protein